METVKSRFQTVGGDLKLGQVVAEHVALLAAGKQASFLKHVLRYVLQQLVFGTQSPAGRTSNTFRQ